MKVLHLTACVGTASYGLGPIALNLAQEQRQAGHDAEAWSCDSEEDIRAVVAGSGIDRGVVRCFKAIGPACRGISVAMRRALCREEGTCDLVHQHGIWTAASLATRRVRRLRETPTIIAPHGALGGWAIARSAWKKRLALTMYERDNLRAAECLHATSRLEIDDFRRLGLRNPIALVTNGVSPRWIQATADGEQFRKRNGISPHAKILLFLSRVTPKKGLPLLLEAVAQLTAVWGDWLLVIAGPDEFGHEAEVRRQAKRLAVSHRVRFVGPVYGEERLEAYAAASLFVLPTHNEGSPLVILEALARGVPVITTVAAGWTGQEFADVGWNCAVSAESIAGALSEALTLSELTLSQYGRRGRQMVAQRYTWRHSADELLSVYRWLLGESSRPVCVH